MVQKHMLKNWRGGLNIDKLSPDKPRNVSDPKMLDVEPTAQLIPLEEIISQERAVRALKFGLDIKERGFNVHVADIFSSRREATARKFLEDLAKDKPVPSDRSHVNNFNNSFTSKATQWSPPREERNFEKKRRT